MSDCKCGHLICTFPDCDNGEHVQLPSMCKECGLILCTCDEPQPVFDGDDDHLICKECGLIIGTCDTCFNGD